MWWECFEKYFKLFVNIIYYHGYHNANVISIRKIIHPPKHQLSKFSETNTDVLGA